MNEPTKIEMQPAEIAAAINAIKRKTAREVVDGAIEIGRLLCEAKEKVDHGAWGDWLAENVQYSVSNANNMMRLYREREAAKQIDIFGGGGTDVFEGLTKSQAIELLGLPPEDRQKFVEKHDMQELSTRELHKEIKDALDAKREAEERAKAAEEESRENERIADDLKTQIEKMKAETIPAARIKEIEAKATKAAEDAAKKKIADAKERAQKEIEAAKKSGADAVASAKKEWEKAEDERIAKAVEEERNRHKQETVRSSAHLSTFNIWFEQFKAAYAKMCNVVAEALEEEPEVGEKLQNALENIKKMF